MAPETTIGRFAPRRARVIGAGVEYGAFATTHFCLSYLAELGLDRNNPQIERAAEQLYQAKQKYLHAILPEAFAQDGARLARFEREAKMLAALNHPNIASIYGLEQSGDQRFLVLELAEGETLQEKLDKGSMDAEDALELCRQVCDGLGAAHEKGVIHRDLKPGNIMVSPGGEVKILDFGIARVLGAASITRTSCLVTYPSCERL